MLSINSVNVVEGAGDVVSSALDSSLLAVDIDYVDPVSTGEVAGAYDVPIVSETSSTDDVKAPGGEIDVANFTSNMGQLVIDQCAQSGKKLPQAFETMVPEARAVKTLEVTKDVLVKVLRIFTAMKLDKASVYTEDDELTKANVKDFILAHVAAMNEDFVYPTHLEVSAKVYNLLKSAAGAEFTPVTNDTIEQTGQIGIWQGMKVIMNPLIGRASTSYSYMKRSESGSVTKTAVDFSKFEYLLYDYRYVYRHDNLNGFKCMDSYTGFSANLLAEIDFGGMVTDSKAVSAKKVATV